MSRITAMYIRLSMEDEDVSLNQKEESNSVSSQRELLEAFIGNHSELKDTKVQEYCDDGFTGTKFERPDYMIQRLFLQDYMEARLALMQRLKCCF